MIKTTTYELLGFGAHANDKIEIQECFTDSNDAWGAYVYINGELAASSDSTAEAIRKALDEKTAEWIFRDTAPTPRPEPETWPTADITIPKARKEAGLTLTKMSKLTGIPLRTIQSWESGERSCPDWTQKLIIRNLKGWKESRSIFTDKTIARLALDAKNYKSDEELKFIDGVGWEDWMEEFEVEKISDILTGIFKEAHQSLF